MAEIEDLKIVGGSTYTVGNQDIIANGWEAGKTYVKNRSYVIQEHRLYVCNVTHTSVEPFDTTKWTEITIGDAIGNNIGDLSTLTTTDKSSLVGAVNEVNASKMTMLRLKHISITGATGTAWTPHYYTDIDISSYFTGADASAVIIGVIINQQTSGGVLCAMLQGARTIRLLNDQAFTNVTCNITCLYYRT